MTDRPEYDRFTDMSQARGVVAVAMAQQVLATVGPWLTSPISELRVLDAGSGYGATTLALAESCAEVTGLEPASHLHDSATAAAAARAVGNVRFLNLSIEELQEREEYDLIVLDNVYEHLPDHAAALMRLTDALRPGGVLYLLVPNKVWPIEAHYRLPFLSWLPLSWATRYLRLSGRGDDYRDASYAPTVAELRTRLSEQHLQFQFVLPGVPDATKLGLPVHYRVGIALLRRVPALWWISKALLVVAIKQEAPSARPGP